MRPLQSSMQPILRVFGRSANIFVMASCVNATSTLNCEMRLDIRQTEKSVANWLALGMLGKSLLACQSLNDHIRR